MTTKDIQRYVYKGKLVRTLMIDGVPWFVAADVCAILGLTNVTEALRKLFEDNIRISDVTDSIGRQRSTRMVNEGGLYMLAMRSNTDEGRAFQRWVANELLPTLRRQGFYVMNNKDDDLVEGLEQSLAALQGVVKKLKHTDVRLDEAENRLVDVEDQVAQVSDHVRALDGTNVTGTERQQLVALINLYSIKAGVPHSKGWIAFRSSWNRAFNENLTSRITFYCRANGLPKLSAPEYLEHTDRLKDGLRVAYKMLEAA